MKHVDYLIVGCGLAGLSFCHILKQHNKSFMVINDDSQKSSTVAGGLYNPVVLKRFTSVWRSKEQLDLALPFYKTIEDLLQITLDYKTPVYRLFKSVEEQNNWFQASDDPKLREFIDTDIIQLENNAIDAKFGFGHVLQTGRVDTLKLVQGYQNYLRNNDQFLQETIDYDYLEIDDHSVIYRNIQAKQIIFCEGFGLKQNPYFNYLPLKETKGELITINAPELHIDFVLKSSVFLIPIGDHNYRVGATFDKEDKTNDITQKGREELLNKLRTFLRCEFKVIDQVAGIRPTVRDRRPLVGCHASYDNVYVLNGLGTRGVMIAPYVANQLYNFIENNTPLDKEIDINRFS